MRAPSAKVVGYDTSVYAQICRRLSLTGDWLISASSVCGSTPGTTELLRRPGPEQLGGLPAVQPGEFAGSLCVVRSYVAPSLRKGHQVGDVALESLNAEQKVLVIEQAALDAVAVSVPSCPAVAHRFVITLRE